MAHTRDSYFFITSKGWFYMPTKNLIEHNETLNSLIVALGNEEATKVYKIIRIEPDGEEYDCWGALPVKHPAYRQRVF